MAENSERLEVGVGDLVVAIECWLDQSPRKVNQVKGQGQIILQPHTTIFTCIFSLLMWNQL